MNKTNANAGKGRALGRVTLADVAAHAGVATMTASRALTQPELVSEELRTRVAKAVQELGYLPNRAARALASARSKVIAVLIPSFSNTVFTDVLAGIQDVLDADGYQLLIGNTRYSEAEEEKLFITYLQSNPDGILLSGLTHSPRMQQMLDNLRVPHVAMMDMALQAHTCSVGFSQQQAGYTMTRYLLDKGHKRIAFMAAQLDERVLKRGAGYRQALLEAGVYDARLECLVKEPSTIALGSELLGRILSSAPDCDAIFCCNDDLAHGAIFQCQRRGIAVPGQVAIAGFNDLAASAWMNPALTTIATPRYRIGFEAASLLQTLIRKEQPAQTHIDLGYTLMARESA
jgi:LacI family gluconate utilization system Gnt-I transcriptional repressor